MTRPTRRLTSACLAAGLLTSITALTSVAPSYAAEAPESDVDPLTVTIDRLGPSTIPQRGPIDVRGVVTNASDTTWTGLRVYLLTSPTPMTTAAELAEATLLDPVTSVGDRLAEEGQFIAIPDLVPGESTRYRIKVPRSELEISGDPGVYWLGIQVLGEDEAGRVDGADGRARTFIPLMRQRNPPSTSLALMMSFRGRIAYDGQGKVASPDAWRAAFREQGRMGRLLELSRSAGPFPLTWVVDPALIDLARSLVADDPGLPLGVAEDSTPSAAPSESPPPDEEPELSEEAAAVQEWLNAFLAEAARRDLLAVPYGDLDVAGALSNGFDDLVVEAQEHAEATLRGVDLPSTPVVDPPDGALPWEALEALGPQVPVLLDETAVAARGPRVDVPNVSRLTLTDTGADDGLPSADGPQSPLALRQRILAEAAVRALSPDRDAPLVVQLPLRYDPGAGWGRAEFFEGLDVPWLMGTSAESLVSSGTATETIEPDSEELRYPADDAELPYSNFASTVDLTRLGRRIDVLLPRDDTIGDLVASRAYLGSSSQMRDQPERAEGHTRLLIATLEGLMEEVTVTGPTFVTMSSEDGPFQVTITNGLAQPISVGVEGRAVGTDRITIPAAPPITIPPGQRRSVRMHASSSRIGVWPIVLEPVNADGDTLGGSTELRIRSSHVGRVVWAVLGGGTLLLVFLIVIRVRRKVKARQSTPGPLLKEAES